MARRRRFTQVDVFASTPYRGNPVAVVLDADGLDTEAMARFANWTNLSETTFVLPPTSDGADYRVRIFTPMVELPFAGHPTLGTCHAWLAASGGDPGRDAFVQECGAGLVEIRRTGEGLAFASPPLMRGGPVDEPLVARIVAALGLGRDEVVDAQWVDNGPGWAAVLLESAERVLELAPAFIDADVGAVGFHAPGAPEAIEVRAFFPKDGAARRGPCDRQPERVGGRVARGRGPPDAALCRPAGDGAGARGPCPRGAGRGGHALDRRRHRHVPRRRRGALT